jgi:hypothetical protein
MHSKRCPHTGVVNYFTDADPLLAVGSVAEVAHAAAFAWHCYVGEETSGLAPDLSRAEQHLERAIARGETRARSCRQDTDGARPSPAARYW